MSKNDRSDDGAPDQNSKGVNRGSVTNGGKHGGSTDNRPGDKGNSHGNERR